mmetsp:Transcript_32229/g.48070  ORF Transcript_32229/g.48070 Transcript_32229/m.48070 type:complete len:81 (+) Transcript_32229:324-566(+)
MHLTKKSVQEISTLTDLSTYVMKFVSLHLKSGITYCIANLTPVLIRSFSNPPVVASILCRSRFNDILCNAHLEFPPSLPS